MTSMSKQGPVGGSTLAAAVGRRLRELREEAGRSQNELANSARRAGIDWTRASVASLESGRRGLSADEFVLLPVALKILTGRDQWALADLLPDEWIRFPVGVGVRVHARSLRRLLAGETVEAWAGGAGTAREMRRIADQLDQQSEAVRHVAQRLNVGPGTVSRLADELWGRTLDDEREHRVTQRLGDRARASGRAHLQAIRGHATRDLIEELKQAINDQEVRE